MKFILKKSKIPYIILLLSIERSFLIYDIAWQTRNITGMAFTVYISWHLNAPLKFVTFNANGGNIKIVSQPNVETGFSSAPPPKI